MKSKKNMKIKHNPGNFPIISKKGESGFSLIEVIIALMVLLIAVLGIFATFTYATLYNTGNSQRSQALSISQEQIELLRSKKFTPTFMDPALKGGKKTPQTVTRTKTDGDGGSYVVDTTVDDDPFISDTQIDDTKTLKEITITVTPQGKTSGWITAIPTKVIFRRVRAN